MPPRMFSVEGTMGLRSWRYADGTANLRAVVAANTSIADGVASALKPRRTRISPYPAAATARATRISKTTFQGFMFTSLKPARFTRTWNSAQRWAARSSSKTLMGSWRTSNVAHGLAHDLLPYCEDPTAAIGSPREPLPKRASAVPRQRSGRLWGAC